MTKKYVKYILLFFLLFIILPYISYHVNLNKDMNNFINFLMIPFDNKNKNLKLDFFSLYLNKIDKTNYFIKDNQSIKNIEMVFNNNNNNKLPTIYIYNTHSNEEYKGSKNDIKPTVITASHILKEQLDKFNINSIIETENVQKLVNEKKLLYKDSYKISRELLENKFIEYPSLEYFIDIHRDSVKRDITTITINEKSYARLMFVLGLENPNYLENKKVITEINDYLDSNYPGLSRGIYEKQGYGVNGVYNQDFNSNVMLIEIGGVDNTISEVFNSINVLANAIYDIQNK